jgi:hypothetical protein
MTLTIEVPPEVEAELRAQADAQGLGLSMYVERVLREQAADRSGSTLAPAERAALWRESAKRLPHTPPLSDEAISRESIYSDHV